MQEVFAVDITTAIGTCAACGTAEPVGAFHVFRGAGIVLRCPHCNNAVAKIVESEARTWVSAFKAFWPWSRAEQDCADQRSA